MKIESIEVLNVKLPGRRRYQLEKPVAVFVGDSYSGKTSILDAVRIVLLGKHPDLGARPSDTFRLAAGGKSEMGVKLELSGGLLAERSWTMNKRGSIATAESVPESLLGKFPPLAFNLQEFLGMTGKQRTERLLQLSDVSAKWPFDRVASRLRALKVEAPTKETEAALQELVTIADDFWAAAQDEGVTVQCFMQTVGEQFTAKAQSYRTQAQVMQSTVAGAQALDTGAPARNVRAELAAARDALETALAKESAELAKIEQQRATYAAAKASRASWEAMVTQARARASATLADAGEVEAEFKAALIEWNEVKLSEFFLDGKRLDPERAPVILDANYGDAIRKAAAAESGLAATRRDIGDMLRQKAALEAMECCPHCKSTFQGWKAHLQESIETKLIELVNKEKREDAAAWCAATAAEDLRKLVQQAKQLAERTAKAKQRHEAAQAAVNALGAAQQARAEAQTQLDRLLANEPPQAGEDLNSAGVNLAVRDLRELADACRRKVRGLEEEQAQFERQTAREETRLKAVAERAAATAGAEVFKLGAAEVTAMQQEMVRDSIQQVLAPVSSMTVPVLDASAAYVDGVFGLQRASGCFVPMDVLSGTETAVLFAGLSVALAGQVPFRLVMIDELGVMDPQACERVLETMAHLVKAGEIDQFLGASSRPVLSHYTIRI